MSLKIKISRMLSCLLLILVFPLSGWCRAESFQNTRFSDLIETFAGVHDRSSGTRGAEQSAEFIYSRFRALDFSHTGFHSFQNPVRRKKQTQMIINGKIFEIDLFLSNVISPDTVPKPGMTGRLVYAGRGEMKDFNHKEIKGSLVLMDLDSGGNWLNALALGARAVIYLYEGVPDKFLFQDKMELSPVKFPRFLVSKKNFREFFLGTAGKVLPDEIVTATIISEVKWVQSHARNVFCLVKGRDRALEDELIVVEAFYDISAFVPGTSPGADQACSIASLLDLAGFLKENPPGRSVLLVATAGHGNGLAGMREMIWSLNTKSEDLEKQISRYGKIIAQKEEILDFIRRFTGKEQLEPQESREVQKCILDVVRAKIDAQSDRLMQLRLEKEPNEKQIKTIAARRMTLKRLESRNNLSGLTPEETGIIEGLLPEAVARQNRLRDNALVRRADLEEALAFTTLAKKKKIQTIVSLHLSSHGSGIGAFNSGWLYDIKNAINPFPPYVKLDDALNMAGKEASLALGMENIFQDTLRPSLHRSWKSHFKDTPALGGEVSRLAGFLGISLVSINDVRLFWNTPWDSPEKVDIQRAAGQSRFISSLIHTLSRVPDLGGSRTPKNGFAELRGRANFLRHGAVFADAPSPGSMVLAFQGPALYTQMVDESGFFHIKGIATKKLTLHKVILDGYKFDPVSGETVAAVDKKKTTIDRYRVKVSKEKMETDLIMFHCSQTTVLNLLEPRTFRYLTKIRILDARTDALPVRHWYSRIDTRSSLINSIYLQPGTRLKLALSDTLLTQKIILTHAREGHPAGTGYRVDETPIIAPTQFLAATDMWSLVNPRINNLEEKGINNQKIRDLQAAGNQALDDAEQALASQEYDRFFKASGDALALAGRVYDHVESIQKDVLYGVLFYIVLFAPFAFCLERLAFAFISIYKRIVGFIGILIALIAVIYQVHPAFELAYSPIVIILAFFIIGLSSIVTWIIFRHFENEMKGFQNQGRRGNEGEISLFKAFFASFFMGINNLRRRRVRTALTCTTLIILTFTIMSFTSVKNIRQHSKLLYNEKVPYKGMLVKQVNWGSLPPRAFKVIQNTMAQEPAAMTAAPRGWMESDARTQSVKVPVFYRETGLEAQGMIGLSPREAGVSGLPGFISSGRWFTGRDRYSVLVPEQMARRLGLPDPRAGDRFIRLWSIPFKVIGTFRGKTFDRFKDLDGEPLSPAIFPDEVFQEVTEAEMEAMESGDEIKTFQSRYKHIPFDQTLIIPYETLISLGGHLKSVAMKPEKEEIKDRFAFRMLDRFGLWLFSGEENGVFVYNASDGLNYSGLPNVLVPVLISIFIVLNTMIGSVQERKREIGIYTSIGMAPSHVSIIFIAEALSYAVLSVVLGYLLAQVTVKVFAGTALLSGLTVNYSSLGGVFAMAMVMLVVVLSSVYPSRVAASIAIPDVEKSWELEKAKGDTLDIGLPFLIKKGEEKSVCGYLYQLFDEHRAVSHGLFSVGRLEMETAEAGAGNFNDIQENPVMRIGFTAWLAPFDLGVMQEVDIRAISSTRFRGYQELEMAIFRKSGEKNTWWRINKRFVNLVRKQLLIWRSMETGEKDKCGVRVDEYILEQESSIG
ncbi:FtsX-like permease family protein [Desulfospira joergensenii]|uniref:FtsX-like permease family protein n=1 Tax=Desulfospira joergensenii TaxID=53329 RepID=UPI00041ABF9C|nr:FtsX-like permease family protein [Desulfospira joergensenii]